MSQALDVAMLLVSISLGLCILRLWRGPSLPDRVVALDQIGIHVVGLAVLYSIQVDEIVFLDVAIVTALLAFITTAAFARYLEQGKDI